MSCHLPHSTQFVSPIAFLLSHECFICSPYFVPHWLFLVILCYESLCFLLSHPLTSCSAFQKSCWGHLKSKWHRGFPILQNDITNGALCPCRLQDMLLVEECNRLRKQMSKISSLPRKNWGQGNQGCANNTSKRSSPKTSPAISWFSHHLCSVL